METQIEVLIDQHGMKIVAGSKEGLARRWDLPLPHQDQATEDRRDVCQTVYLTSSEQESSVLRPGQSTCNISARGFTGGTDTWALLVVSMPVRVTSRSLPSTKHVTALSVCWQTKILTGEPGDRHVCNQHTAWPTARM